jgi:hypothetical protein
MNKRRNMAYRRLESGARYHAGELSALTIGQKRTTTLSDLRGSFDKLKKKAEYHTRARIEYFVTWVHDYNEEKGGWRRHAHVIWTSKETEFTTLLKWLEDSAKKPMSLYIDRNVEQTPWKLHYALQYAATKQGESTRYAMSEGWLPKGCEDEWKKIRERDRGMNVTMNDSICDLNRWIDKQRTIVRDWSQQTQLSVDNGTRETPHSPKGKPPVRSETTAKWAFVKRRLKNV